MTNLIITIIISIGIAAAAVLSAGTLFRSARDNFDQQMNWARLDQAAAALRSQIIMIDGLPTVPLGEAGPEGYSTLPGWVTANRRDINNRSFVYCPYAIRDNLVAGTSGTVSGPGYAVRTYSSSLTNNRSYVVGSIRPSFTGSTTMAPQGLIALLISFKPEDTYNLTSAQGWCNNIAVSATGQLSTGGTPTVTGIVYPIVVPQSHYQQIQAKNETVTLYVETTAAGDRTGRNVANATTLDAAMAQLAALKPQRARIFLGTGTHTITNFYPSVYEAANLRNITYEFEGQGIASTTIGLSSPGYTLPVHTIFRSLTISGSLSDLLVSPGIRFYLVNAASIRAVIAGGELWTSGTSSITGSITVRDGGRLVVNGTLNANSITNQGIVIRTGRLDITSAGNLTVTTTSTTGSPKAPVVIRAGGVLGIDGGSMTVTSSGVALEQGIKVVPGGAIYMNDSTLTFNTGTGSISDHAIVMGGDMAMNNAALAFPSGTASGRAAVALVDGGAFYLHNNSRIGSASNASERPNIGVFDNGGTFVGGSSTGYVSGANGEGGSPQSNIYAASGGMCWSGASLPATAPATRQRHLFMNSNHGGGQVSTAKGTNNVTSGMDCRHIRIANQTNWACTGPTAVATTTPCEYTLSVTGPAAGNYVTGNNLNFTATFNSAVVVTGTPRIAITIGSTTRHATYLSGSGTAALTFRYTVVAGDSDADGIAIASPIDLNGGTIRQSGLDIPLVYSPPSLTSVTVNAGPDTVPDAFSIAQCGTSGSYGSFITSTTTPAGYTDPASYSVSLHACTSCSGGETFTFRINGSNVSNSGTISPGQNISIRYSFCNNPSTMTVRVNIGGTILDCALTNNGAAPPCI